MPNSNVNYNKEIKYAIDDDDYYIEESSYDFCHEKSIQFHH